MKSAYRVALKLLKDGNFKAEHGGSSDNSKMTVI